jgi:hypothetical protein
MKRFCLCGNGLFKNHRNGRFLDGLVNRCVRINPAAGGGRFVYVAAAIGTNPAWRENLMIAVGANSPNQSVALLLESPVSWNFHGSLPFDVPNSIPRDSQTLSELDPDNFVRIFIFVFALRYSINVDA